MIDLQQLRADPERARASQRARGEAEDLVDALLAADAERRSLVAAADGLRAEANVASKAIGAAAPEQRPARIEQALAAGFVPAITPVLVRPEVMEGTGFLGQAAENVYHLPGEDLYLVGTSEAPLAAYHMNETLDAASLPRRYAGWSSCFRREAGSYGKDVRGIMRVHQFDKVEMFSFCHPDDAAAEHMRLLAWEKEMLAKVEVPYRVIDVAAGDLGASAARKYDCEAWIPTQERYREMTSTSNCTDYQARRLGIRMRDEGGTRHVATLNGTLATTRWLVAILENHQQSDGSVRVPAALVPYVGREVLEPLT